MNDGGHAPLSSLPEHASHKPSPRVDEISPEERAEISALSPKGSTSNESYPPLQNPVEGEAQYVAQARDVLARSPDLTGLDDLNGMFTVANITFDVYDRGGNLRSLSFSIATFREALRLCPEQHRLRPLVLLGLGRSLDARYTISRVSDDAEEGIGLLQDALVICPTGHPFRKLALDSLASAFAVRYKQQGGADYIDRAINFYREATELFSPDDPHRPTCLSNLGSALLDRYSSSGSTHDIGEGLKVHREALAQCPVESVGRVSCLNNLGSALRLHYEQQGCIEDLEEAVVLHREAVTCSEPGSVKYALAVENLGYDLGARFRVLGGVDDLDEAIRLHRRALELQGPESIYRSISLSTLANELHDRFVQNGDISDLQEAITCHREAVRLRPDGHPQRPFSLHNLAVSVATRFRNLGDSEDLAEAQALLRNAIVLCPPGHPDRVIFLDGLAGVLTTVHNRLGRLDDLDEASGLLREVLEMCPDSHPGRAVFFNTLANILTVRFHTLNFVSDLEEIVHLQRESLVLRPAGHPNRSMSLSLLGGALHDRYLATHNLRDIDEAVVLQREAVALRLPQQRDRYIALDNLALALLTRFEALGEMDDIGQVIRLHREALGSLGAENPNRPLSLMHLANAYRILSTRTKIDQDAIQARDAALEALRLLTPGQNRRPRCLYVLSLAYLETQASFYDPLLALRYLTDAISDSHHHALQRMNWAVIVLGKVEDCSAMTDELRTALVEGYRLTIGLLPRVAYFGLNIRSRLQVLAQAEDVAAAAATHALALSRTQFALELLEEGRAVFWTQMLRLRTQFDQLPSAVREKLSALSQQLEKGSHERQENGSAPILKTAWENEGVRMRHLSEDFESTVEEARALPGFERFMLHAEYATLARAAEHGPVVILVASMTACEAIVVKGVCTEDVKRVPLSSVTPNGLRSLSEKLRDVAGRDRDSLVDTDDRALKKKMIHPTSTATLAEKQGAIDVFKELWTSVVEPIINTLELLPRTGRDRPRVWWCPTGAFTFVPVHVAGTYVQGGPCCSDYVVSSYTPTLGALLQARQSVKPILRKDATVLLAAVPRPCQGQDLPFTVTEIEEVKAVVPSSLQIPLPPDDDASLGEHAGITVQTLIDALPQATILHLACHGKQNARNPLESGFVLRDRVLTISQLIETPLPNAFLAFLSACETAKGDRAQPDQTIHLAATMLFAGFKSVVGTMWSMSDLDGPVVARAVYAQLFDGDADHLDPDAVPYALDDAVQKLRASGCHPTRWAPYIHIGI